MEIMDIQRPGNREVVIKIRTSLEGSNFMRRNNISPTALFNKALAEVIKSNENRC